MAERFAAEFRGGDWDGLQMVSLTGSPMIAHLPQTITCKRTMDLTDEEMAKLKQGIPITKEPGDVDYVLCFYDKRTGQPFFDGEYDVNNVGRAYFPKVVTDRAFDGLTGSVNDTDAD